ncbi:MAG: chorismate--pyruvate lyase [Hydrogenophilales bacterium 17-64-65]|nr:MAG: chorismate--pyruvate lyase [Hydrogenophilales bacterium 16-64-40]OZA34149.1 MAG: chorismate--pyruvate lyase [Hydrogenophilales bacterium 17-64-65]
MQPFRLVNRVSHSRQGWLGHPHPIPRSLRSWLSDRGSLTQRLKARCASFRVVPLTTGIARPNPDEYALLGMAPGSRAYVREVMLLCNEVPVVFAHSVLPYAGLRGGWNGITRIGSRSLGEALFSDHRIARQPLAYRQLRQGHALFHAIARQQLLAASSLWARRSVFCLNGHPLLVTEVFLPAIDTP